MRAQRQHQVAARVDDRQPEDGAVLAQQAIGDHRADRRQRVDRRDEQVKVRLRERGGRGGELRVVHVKLPRQVKREDRAHAVVAEALAPFVADDVRDAGRPAGRVVVGRAARLGTHAGIVERAAAEAQQNRGGSRVGLFCAKGDVRNDEELAGAPLVDCRGAAATGVRRRVECP